MRLVAIGAKRLAGHFARLTVFWAGEDFESSQLPEKAIPILWRASQRRLCPGEKVSNCLYMMNQNPGERMGSDPIASEKVAFERKIFFLDLKENQRGRFLKITEDVGGRRDTIMLPSGAFKDFLEALQRLVEFEGKL